MTTSREEKMVRPNPNKFVSSLQFAQSLQDMTVVSFGDLRTASKLELKEGVEDDRQEVSIVITVVQLSFQSSCCDWVQYDIFLYNYVIMCLMTSTGAGRRIRLGCGVRIIRQPSHVWWTTDGILSYLPSNNSEYGCKSRRCRLGRLDMFRISPHPRFVCC